MNATHCSFDDGRDVAARYVAERLADAEREEFEQHLLGCASCREAVHEGAAIRSALRLRRRRRQRALFAPLGAAAVAGVAWIILTPGPLEKLGRIDHAPRLATMEVRANPDSAAQFAELGMQAYAAGDYREAARRLSLARETLPEPAVAFFLGAAHLMAGHPDSAAIALRAVTAEDSPYRHEAHYYAAKAWLQLGEADSATAHLRAIGDRALIDSIGRVR